MPLSSLNELFLHELKELYDAEHQLVEALPRMVKAASQPELRTALDKHLAETRKQVARLREVFTECGEDPERGECDGLRAVIEEGERFVDEADESPVRDAALISGARRVEHYEMARYDSLIIWAQAAGFSSAQRLLEQTLEEERAADEKLSDIAESGFHAGAGALEEEEDTGNTTRTGSRSPTAVRARTGAPARSRRAKK
ncbi:MAG TPA: ferritin-like domain-containing protein [Gemmatimonadales bacterium]|nr:ferritin-like domain-containing protein [Gemmatimonadales bacterium]